MQHLRMSEGWQRWSVLSYWTFALVLLGTCAAMGQLPCNPAIDGTYCATAGIKDQTDLSSAAKATRESFGTMSGAGFYEQPATLGAITFSSSGRCIGLIRRTSCRD